MPSASPTDEPLLELMAITNEDPTDERDVQEVDDNFGEGGSNRPDDQFNAETPPGPSNFDNPTRSLGGRAHREADRQMRHMYDASDLEGEESDAGNGDTAGARRYSNKPKEVAKSWKWEDANEDMIIEFKESGLKFAEDGTPVGNGPLANLYTAARGVLYDQCG